MVSHFNNLINLPVYTQSGLYLGRVVGFEIDKIDNQVSKYFVKSPNPITNLFRGKLQIDRSQVIKIDREKMVVDDNIKKIKNSLPEPALPA